MKQFTLFIVTILFLFGCLQTNSPKSTVVKFISQVKKLDFENSGALVTDETKNVFAEAKLKLQNSPAFEEELSKSKALNESDIIKTYGLDQLIERVSGKNAIVLTKDSTNKINLEKVGGSWKIVCTDYIINGFYLKTVTRKML